MRLTKPKNPKSQFQSTNQQKKTLISNYLKNKKKPESEVISNIIPKNSSFDNLKEGIHKEQTKNNREFFTSNNSRLKTIQYSIQATSRENKKSSKSKVKPNLGFLSYHLPEIYTQKDKSKEKIKKPFFKKIENISPIETTEYKTKYNKTEQYLNDSPLNIILQRNRINSNNEISQNEVNIQYINDKNDNQYYSENKLAEKNNKDNLFYHKVQYKKKNNNNKRGRNHRSYYDFQDIIEKDENIKKNKTINNFYVHKQINKSGLLENNNKTCNNSIKQYKNNNQGINVFYSTKNINYDIMYNFRENDSYNHPKNISSDDYYNLQQYYNNHDKTYFNKKIKNKIKDPFYIPEEDNESDTNPLDNDFNRVKYNNKSNKVNIEQKNKKTINYYREDNNSNNLIKSRNKKIYGYNNIDNLSKIKANNTYSNNDFSFRKILLKKIKSKGSINNTEESQNKNIVFKKKAIQDNSNINLDINKYNINKFNIYSNISFSIFSDVKNKIIFDKESDIIDYINDKFMKEKNHNFENKYNYTGFTLIKKFKGKTLFEIKIDDDINNFNKILKKENIKIGNQYIEIIPINEKENIEIIKKNIINLKNQLENMKKENEALNKKDFLKNELINKLDKEKQNILRENKKILNEINNLKKTNEELNIRLMQYTSKINKEEKNNNNYKEDSVVKINFLNKQNNIKKSSVKMNNEENKTPSSNELSNNLSININNSNLEIGHDSKKNNPVSIFRLSKISEIKKIDNNNIDSEREIKNNLDILNEELINNQKNKVEIKPFNNKEQ